MPGDVLDHHDGVVHQDADGKDQGKQADTVDGVAHQIGCKEREQDRRRDHHQRHQCFAPPDRQCDQDDNGNCRKPKMEQQFIGFFIGGLTVVPGDLHIHAFGKEISANCFKP